MRVLIIGSLDGHVSTAAKMAMTKGAKVAHVQSIDEALDALRSGRGADLLLVDVVLDIEDLTRALQKERIIVPIVACGVKANPKRAELAIQSGAKEYISMPPDPEMIAAILQAVSHHQSSVVYEDPITEQLLKFAKRIAPSDASVLITGESGTGKEVMARFLHENSKRKDNPFISLNCAAIPENLLESELFGHEKGAFTGAVSRRIGKFEEANGGTLLLDEISEMHPHMQAKLLRAIQERVIDRVGGSQPVKIDIRILATSNRDLKQTVAEGKFREDLYFRLNVVNVQIPALRERKKDIMPLAKFFAKKYCDFNHIATKSFDSTAQELLKSYDWPGNVRELENTIHRSVLLSQEAEITGQEMSSFSDMKKSQNMQKSSSQGDFIERSVSEVEKELILDTLDHCLGNRTHAANILGISIRTLRNKLKEYREARRA